MEKKLEEKMKDMVDAYNNKLKEYKVISDELNKMLGGIQALNDVLQDKDKKDA